MARSRAPNTERSATTRWFRQSAADHSPGAGGRWSSSSGTASTRLRQRTGVVERMRLAESRMSVIRPSSQSGRTTCRARPSCDPHGGVAGGRRYDAAQTMQLTPREVDKLLLHVAADVARRRRERGVRLNYPESVALIA